LKTPFQPGDYKRHSHQVTEADLASFETGMVHAVCSTFALGREMEWSSRLFVLDMKDEDEEGIGTFLEIAHHGPAFEGEQLEIQAVLESQQGNEVICSIGVTVKNRPVASGRTGQKILKKDKIKQIFTRLEK
jgi:predicted thioesterase